MSKMPTRRAASRRSPRATARNNPFISKGSGTQRRESTRRSQRASTASAPITKASAPITKASTPITKAFFFNNLKSIQSNRGLSLSQKRLAIDDAKSEFIEASKVRIREQIRAKINLSSTQKQRLLAKIKQKQINKIQNTQKRDDAQQKLLVITQLGDQARQKPEMTRERATAENQEASSSSGIDALGTKYAAAISTIATINTTIPRELGETISVQDINSVTDSVENETRLNTRNSNLAKELRNNIKNLVDFDTELKKGLLAAKCEVGKKCFASKNDITPKQVINKLEQAYSQIGDNNKELKELLNSRCFNNTDYCFKESDRKLTTNEKIKKAVINRINELEKLRKDEKETSAAQLIKKIKLNDEFHQKELEKSKQVAQIKLKEELDKKDKEIDVKINELREANKEIKKLDYDKKTATENHAKAIVQKEATISKLNGEKSTLEKEFNKKQMELKEELATLKKDKNLEINEIRKSNSELKEANTNLQLSLDGAIASKKAADEARTYAESARKEAIKAKDDAVLAANLSEEAKEQAEKRATIAEKKANVEEEKAKVALAEAATAAVAKEKAEKEKGEAEKSEKDAKEKLSNEMDRLSILTKQKNDLERELAKKEKETDELQIAKDKVDTDFINEKKKTEQLTKQLETEQKKLVVQTSNLASERKKTDGYIKELKTSNSKAQKNVERLEMKIKQDARDNKIGIEGIKLNYLSDLKAEKVKFEKEKAAAINSVQFKAILEKNRLQNIYDSRIMRLETKHKSDILIKEGKRKILEELKEKNEKKKERLETQRVQQKILFEEQKKIQAINRYKSEQQNLLKKKNYEINQYKKKAIEEYRRGYRSAQYNYNRILQTKRAEIQRLKTAKSRTLLAYKGAEVSARKSATFRNSVIKTRNSQLKKAHATIKQMRNVNNIKKMKYYELSRKRLFIINETKNAKLYYQTKAETLQKHYDIEKDKNLEIKKSYKEQFKNLQSQIGKLKESNRKSIEMTNKIDSDIKILKTTIGDANRKISGFEKTITQQNVELLELRTNQKADKSRIIELQNQLRGKIFVSECGRKGYTATAGIKANTHVFNGTKYIKEKSIIGDKLYLNGKHYVRLFGGKCMNKYTRPCPKPKVIFRRPHRSANSSDLIKHNRFYIKYRCALIKRLRSRGVDARNWINQRKIIKAKTGKFPRYPPFNTRMCGRGSISRVINRCTGNCARYRGYINLYRSRISKLQREYNFYRSRLSSYSRLFRRYNGSQRGTPAYNYRRAYITYLNLYRRTRNYGFWGRRKRSYRVLYFRYLSLLRREISKGRKYSRLISVYARNVSSRKRQIDTYNNLIRKYQRTYPRQLR